MATVNETRIPSSGLDPITIRTLDAFRRRRAMLLILRAFGVGALVFLSLAFTLATLDYLVFFSDPIRWTLSIGIYLATAAAMWIAGFNSFRTHDPLRIARHVESVAPQLRENLVSAVELSDPQSTNGSLYFRRLLQSRVAKRMSKVDIGGALPIRLVRRWLLSGGSLVALCIAMVFVPSAQFGRRFARAALPGFAIERASNTKISIVEPAPPSRYVAQRDAVAVIVDVLGQDVDDVMLQWRSSDGTDGESLMSPRMDAASFQPGFVGADSDPNQPTPDRFAANLSIGSVPLQYRVIAGDAITLWHELTPLPRPRVVRFEKLYRLPAYAKLSDRSADEEHGDLKALQGSTAEITVTFDQPVEKPVVRFGVHGAGSEMESVDDTDTRFLARISIKTSGQYQIDANSILSGLNNPFSPTNMITPVLDTPPIVRWSDSTKMQQMVSSLDVVPLAAVASDDLPLDRVVQEVQVNEQKFQSYDLTIETPDRKLDLVWSWDLLNRLGESSQTPALEAGDLVKTRLVAIDRRGTRTESPLIELLIAGDGFDADRHQFLDPFSKQVQRVMSWSEQSKEIANRLNEIGKTARYDSLVEIHTQWKSLQQESVALIKTLTQSLSSTQNTASASMTELVGAGIIDVETRLDSQIDQIQWLSEHISEDWKRDHKQHLTDVTRDAEQTAYQCQRLTELAQMQFSMALTAAIFIDVSTLRTSVFRLVDEMPQQRLPRYLTLIAGQLSEIDRLINQYQPLLSNETAQHLSGDHWLRWSQRWNIQIETLIEDQPHRDQIHAVLRSLRDEIKDKPQHVIHSGIHNTALRWGRDLRKEMYYLSDLTRRVADAGRELQNAQKAMQRDRNAGEAAQNGLDANWAGLKWQSELKRLLVRAAGQEKLNRAKSKVDLKYAADQNLFLRAVKNVTENGYQDYEQESADRVLDSIGNAIKVLQATSDVAAAREDWLAVREGESQDDGSPLRKIYHPLWFKLQDVRIELGVRYLRESNIDWSQFLERIDATRYNNDHNQANSRIDSRQWSADPFLSAEKPLQSLASDLQLGLESLEPKREEARDVLRRFVLTLSEQARQAAEQAEHAKQVTDQRNDSTRESMQQLQPEQDLAVEKATETISALIDRANTANMIDDEAREIARDADAAAEWIAEAVNETKEAMKSANSITAAEDRGEAIESIEQQMAELSERLTQTAEHFEKIEQGDDVTQSRQQLRQAEAELKSADTLDQRYDRADQMADAAKQDPRELLRQLEEELKRNEPMQSELSEISANLLKQAAENLKQSAKDEDSLQRRLESEDDAFLEQKRQHQMMLEEFVTRARTLSNQTLATLAKAAGSAEEPKTHSQIDQTKQQINDAIAAVESFTYGQPTSNELQLATQGLQQAMQQAASAVAPIAEQLQESSDKDLHGDKQKRNRAAETMQRMENQLRNEEVRALDQQRHRWQSQESDAKKRLNSAEKQKNQIETTIKREQDRIQKDPQNEWIKAEIARQQEQLEEADRTIGQARRTMELAEQRTNKAIERTNAINQSKTSSLDKLNPAAELGEHLANDAANRLRDLAEDLKQLGDHSDGRPQLHATSDSAMNIQRQQRTVQDDVQESADDLARAARHEARLENAAAADRLNQAALQTETNAGQAANRAADSIQDAAENHNQSAAASEALQDAARAIDAQAQSLEALLGQSNPQPASPSDGTDDRPADAQESPAQHSPAQRSPAQRSPAQRSPAQRSPAQRSPSADATQSPSPSTGLSNNADRTAPNDQASPKQLAQTLDDLDRSLAAQQAAGQSPSSQKPGDGQGQPSGQADGQPGESANGQPGQNQPGTGQPGDGQPSDTGQLGTGQPPQNAIEASATLAQMLEAQMQQAARERMESLQQAQSGDPSGDPSNTSASSTNPASESGQGEMPAGGDSVNLIEGALGDGDWGDLRSRGVDDAVQGRSSRIPSGYSREIKAYFQALSKRAAEPK